jgi:hypothetical protein
LNWKALVDMDLDVDITGFSSAEVEILFDQARAPSPGRSSDESSGVQGTSLAQTRAAIRRSSVVLRSTA